MFVKDTHGQAGAGAAGVPDGHRDRGRFSRLRTGAGKAPIRLLALVLGSAYPLLSQALGLMRTARDHGGSIYACLTGTAAS